MAYGAAVVDCPVCGQRQGANVEIGDAWDWSCEGCGAHGHAQLLLTPHPLHAALEEEEPMFRDHFNAQGTPEQNARVKAALDRFTAQHLRLSMDVPVEFANLQGYASSVHEGHFHAGKIQNVPPDGGASSHGIATAEGPAGLFMWAWYSDGRIAWAKIQIEQGLSPQQQEVVFIAEAAHAIDILSPDWTNADRGEVYDAYHDWPAGTTGPITWEYQGAGDHRHGWFGPQGYFDTPGESFMVGVIRAFTDYSHQDWWSHTSDQNVIDVIRRVLSAGAPPVATIAVWRIRSKATGKLGGAYHRNASTSLTSDDCYWVRNARAQGATVTNKRLVKYPDQAAARAAGAKPCGTCKPG